MVSCDKPREGANNLRSGDFRMRELNWGHAQLSITEYIGYEKTTGGTETSKYSEEKKSNEIPLVAASERGIAQTYTMSSSQALLYGCCRSYQA